jgi:hypothetical protein
MQKRARAEVVERVMGFFSSSYVNIAVGLKAVTLLAAILALYFQDLSMVFLRLFRMTRQALSKRTI